MKRNLLKQLSVSLAAGVLTFLFLFTNLFYTWDKMVLDGLCQTGDVADSRIFILAIDDKTLQEYGPMNQWSREISSQVVKTLNQNEEVKPAVITFDIMYIESTQEEVDAEFAKICEEAGNVITAFNLQFKEQPKMDENGKITFDTFHVDEADFPFEDLKNGTDFGYANTVVDKDGYVRRFKAITEYEGEVYYSLATQTYLKYMETMGQKAQMPVLDEDGLTSFQYACRSGEYSVISLCDLLNGTVNPAIFNKGIVYVGAYATGLMDAYAPAISHGSQMYGVEIQANITDALLHGRTQQETSKTVYALAAAVLVAVFFFVVQKLKAIPSAVLMVVLAVSSVLAAKLAYGYGYILPVFVLPMMLVVGYVISMVMGYIAETKRRRQIIGVFKQYMAPQIVEEISKKKDFKVELGGEKRHIAVLFVDIRGFTTMSEALKPEEVVEILNEYLSLTTASIFKNSGTLDKFVGDATMAVFNAPLDLDDYIYKAVKTAWDMKTGSAALAEKFEARFGKSVAFGIGVNCGDAVVGNIGCEFRMDYTAIGDTVNTAARLESNAKRGQILISQEVYDNVKDRVKVTPIGEIPLKGKEQGVFVYQVDDVE